MGVILKVFSGAFKHPGEPSHLGVWSPCTGSERSQEHATGGNLQIKSLQTNPISSQSSSSSTSLPPWGFKAGGGTLCWNSWGTGTFPITGHESPAHQALVKFSAALRGFLSSGLMFLPTESMLGCTEVQEDSLVEISLLIAPFSWELTVW